MLLSLSLKSGFRLYLGFPLDAGSVFGLGFLLGVTGGQSLSRAGNLAEQLIEANRSPFMLRFDRGVGLRILLMLRLALRWPGVAYGDSGLALTFKGTPCCGEVGFELPPPSGYGGRFASALGLLFRLVAGRARGVPAQPWPWRRFP